MMDNITTQLFFSHQTKLINWKKEYPCAWANEVWDTVSPRRHLVSGYLHSFLSLLLHKSIGVLISLLAFFAQSLKQPGTHIMSPYRNKLRDWLSRNFAIIYYFSTTFNSLALHFISISFNFMDMHRSVAEERIFAAPARFCTVIASDPGLNSR